MEGRFAEQLEPWEDVEWEKFEGKLPRVVLEDLREVAYKNNMPLHMLIAVAVLYWWEG